MLPLRIEGATHCLGAPKGWKPEDPPCRGLYARLEHHNALPVFKTAWEPTPAELARIAAGAPIHLSIVGEAHPPVQIQVGEPPTT